MLQLLFFIMMLLVHHTVQWEVEIQADCNKDALLMCPCDGIETMDFISVVWYKLINQRKLGIIRKSKGDNKTNSYSFNRKASFGENYSLLLPRVTPEDSGTYDCTINANIGFQNKNFKINLKVNECVTQAEPTAVTTVFNMSQSTCPSQVKDLPVMWSAIGYVAVGLIKIILSLCSIWVIKIRSSRRRLRSW